MVLSCLVHLLNAGPEPVQKYALELSRALQVHHAAGMADAYTGTSAFLLGPEQNPTMTATRRVFDELDNEFVH